MNETRLAPEDCAPHLNDEAPQIARQRPRRDLVNPELADGLVRGRLGCDDHWNHGLLDHPAVSCRGAVLQAHAIPARGKAGEQALRIQRRHSRAPVDPVEPVLHRQKIAELVRRLARRLRQGPQTDRHRSFGGLKDGQDAILGRKPPLAVHGDTVAFVDGRGSPHGPARRPARPASFHRRSARSA